MDTQGAETARPWIQAAKPSHPSLIDRAHVLGAKLGINNVPMSAWIDEDGMLVRLGDAAFTRESPIKKMEITDDIPESLRVVLTEAKKIQTDHEAYLGALRDWAAKGADSQFALTPAEVLDRAGGRDFDTAKAAACFELGQHLYRGGNENDAIQYWREAHRLNPAIGLTSDRHGRSPTPTRGRPSTTKATGSTTSKSRAVAKRTIRCLRRDPGVIDQPALDAALTENETAPQPIEVAVPF